MTDAEVYKLFPNDYFTRELLLSMSESRRDAEAQMIMRNNECINECIRRRKDSHLLATETMHTMQEVRNGTYRL